MPTIVAICPYCRAGGVRARDSAVGASATCPKCKSSFTLIAEEKLPDWAAKAHAEATAFSAPSAEKPKLSPVDETRATAALLDVTEPSPVLPAEPKPRPAPPRAPATPPDAPHAPADTALVVALLALILVGPAVLASQLPYGRVVALCVAAIGFAGGLLGVLAEGRARLAGGAAAALHFGALVVLLFLPSWLNLDPWSGGTKPEKPKGPVAVDNNTGAPAPVAPNDWLEASKHSWQFDDVRVTVRGATVRPVELYGPNGAKRTTKENYLHLLVLVANGGLERDVALPAWAKGGSDVSATDSGGKALAPATFENGWARAGPRPADRLAPGHTTEAYFVLTAPSPKSPFVQFRLPATEFGTDAEIRFRVGLPAAPPRGPGK